MSENVFKRVKANVSARNVAVKYGLEQGANGQFKCPFHDDKTPSMRAGTNFYCFGCGAKGDCIELVRRLHNNMPPLEAAYMIADDFGIDVRDCKSEKRKRKKPKSNSTRLTYSAGETLKERAK